ncbi:hypothetical protein Barb6_01186 [Bacteroidales bacterium Barb6]|nr:hypothetical protein Barb6_01186 [Bacteroidales bacterium Barb6]
MSSTDTYTYSIRIPIRIRIRIPKGNNHNKPLTEFRTLLGVDSERPDAVAIVIESLCRRMENNHVYLPEVYQRPRMLTFRPIQLSDKAVIDLAFRSKSYMSTDFTFTNLYAWQALFKTVFATEGGTLFLRFTDDDGVCYMMPAGKMPDREALELIMQDARENDFPFILKAVIPQMWESIERAMPGQFRLVPDRMNYEYIYLSEKLLSLSGKKLQSKRNHINRFKADHPEWEYVPVRTDADIAGCLAMLDEWIRTTPPQDDASQRHDYLSARVMLENFHRLQIRGGYIRAEGKIAAFSLGEPLTEDTFVVHVEKAFAGITGAYTIINQQFIEHEAAGYTYINREEDVGLENLRKAKMSYYPETLLEHGIVTLAG